MLTRVVTTVSLVCLLCSVSLAGKPRGNQQDGGKVHDRKVFVPREGLTKFTVVGRSSVFRISVSTISGGTISKPRITGHVKHLGTSDIVVIGEDGSPLIGSIRKEFRFRGTARGIATIEITKKLPTEPMPIVEVYTITIK